MKYVDDILLLVGFFLIVYGVAQVSVPVAIVVAGIFMVVEAVLISKSMDLRHGD
jgi:hypothetical protein